MSNPLRLPPRPPKLRHTRAPRHNPALRSTVHHTVVATEQLRDLVICRPAHRPPRRIAPLLEHRRQAPMRGRVVTELLPYPLGLERVPKIAHQLRVGVRH